MNLSNENIPTQLFPGASKKAPSRAIQEKVKIFQREELKEKWITNTGEKKSMAQETVELKKVEKKVAEEREEPSSPTETVELKKVEKKEEESNKENKYEQQVEREEESNKENKYEDQVEREQPEKTIITEQKNKVTLNDVYIQARVAERLAQREAKRRAEQQKKKRDAIFTNAGSGEIYVKYNQNYVVLKVDMENGTVWEIKKALEAKTGIPPLEQKLVYSILKTQFADHRSLSYYGCQAGGFFILERKAIS